jgi:hypothetical protein
VSYALQARLAGKHVIAVPTDPADYTPHTLSKVLAAAQRDGANPRILLVYFS